MSEITSNVSFGGQEASRINVYQMMKAIEKIAFPTKDDAVHHLKHNGCEEFFFKHCVDVPGTVEAGARTALYGLPVYERNYVPLGKIWMCDRHGRPLKKFKINL